MKKKKLLFVFSSIFLVVGLALTSLGFVLADNKVENLKLKNSPAFYQTVRVNDRNEFSIEISFGDFSLTKLF